MQNDKIAQIQILTNQMSKDETWKKKNKNKKKNWNKKQNK
jgi:hypothetical protein